MGKEEGGKGEREEKKKKKKQVEEDDEGEEKDGKRLRGRKEEGRGSVKEGGEKENGRRREKEEEERSNEQEGGEEGEDRKRKKEEELMLKDDRRSKREKRKDERREESNEEGKKERKGRKGGKEIREEQGEGQEEVEKRKSGGTILRGGRTKEIRKIKERKKERNEKIKQKKKEEKEDKKNRKRGKIRKKKGGKKKGMRGIGREKKEEDERKKEGKEIKRRQDLSRGVKKRRKKGKIEGGGKIEREDRNEKIEKKVRRKMGEEKKGKGRKKMREWNEQDEEKEERGNGIQQRLNSWQDDVTRTNCAIQPDTNWTYAFVVKDQIGTFTYFPSINYQKLAGGFDPIRVNNSVVISVPFPKPEAGFDLLIGDWYFTDYKVWIIRSQPRKKALQERLFWLHPNIVRAITEMIPGIQGDRSNNGRKGIPFIGGPTLQFNLSETNMNNLESDDEAIDTPLVSPFPHSGDSDDDEFLNELSEYENAGTLHRERIINSTDGDDLAFESYNTIMVDGLEGTGRNLVAIVRGVIFDEKKLGSS
ncbi:monocopper oxidase-like protein SKU5 [Tanacetum coccineum]